MLPEPAAEFADPPRQLRHLVADLELTAFKDEY